MGNDYVQGEQCYYHQTLPKSYDKVEIIPIGDIHYGSPTHSPHHLNKAWEYVLAEPYRRVILVGDLIESITRSSIGDIFTQTQSVQKQRDWIINYFKKDKDRILGAVTGNHEARVYNETSIDVTKDIAKALECPYRPEGMLLKISFGTDTSHGGKGQHHPFTYFIYFTHGYGGARTLGGKVAKAERMAGWIHADVYLQGHDHTSVVAPVIYLMPDNRTRFDEESGFQVGAMRAERKLLIKTNAFLKWAGYSEMKGFSPTDLERIVITLDKSGRAKATL